MQKNSLKLVTFLIVLSLTACGQMGPLYLPDQKPPVYVPRHPSKTVL
ncbi:uncharacterized protein RVIR1_05810 [Candidatus Rickettsiella viridis]|uniref:Lipoprotein n=1 Tax=Candidatus Rickettsiella viridis TaxID=676208 RepID=A0A2Z5UVT3_9COXI|nr:lipoprotein [Candidatus Rickettsiella viridis]BBB15083.1 uncharacterized protein RVIR1_05810 [Candidatus Rickettsiella viridis]